MARKRREMLQQQLKDLVDERHEHVNIIKRTNRILTGNLGAEARKSIRDWLAAWEKAQKLRRKGYDVSVPTPRTGRPQLLIISDKARARNK